ncbi:MAG: hypothetical protein ACOYL6_02240 [Bacteriovoracaceae bacterium]
MSITIQLHKEENGVNKANFDYEIELFTGKNKPKLNQEFEYLFWWTDAKKGLLSTVIHYEREYLDYIEGLVHEEVGQTTKPAEKNWWGRLSNPKQEKLLNSKITSSQFAIENNLAHPKTKIVTDVSEMNFAESKQYVLKNPYLMSGKGFMRFLGSEFQSTAKAWAEKQLKQNPLIFEPWLKKRHDFSTYIFLQEEKMESYFNLSNDQGNYKGTVVYSDPNSVFEDLEERGVNLDYYFQSLNLIREHYTQLGANLGMSVDSFTYEENEVLKTYYLSEVNYRKTMGLIALKLKKFLAANGVGQLLMVTKKDDCHFNHFTDYKAHFDGHLYDEKSKKGIILLSPPNQQFSTFFLAAHNKEELDNYLFLIN